MKVYREKENAQIPEFATEGSACFDLRACVTMNEKVTAFNPHNKKMELPTKMSAGKPSVQIHSNFRVLVPTGLIFDIPKNHVMEIFIRSGLALKYGLMLANGTAIIDSDYVDPSYVMIYNSSDTPYIIQDGDRIAQARLIRLKEDYTLTERKSKPERKTDRDGGLGSTGTE